MDKENKMKTVAVCMSTYNGQDYLVPQVESIINQSGVLTKLYVRDDGSQDSTIQILNNLMEKYPGRIEYFKGNNIGYSRSFLKILELAREADYYAFSDQDDVWINEKCNHAIKILENNKQYGLYSSCVNLVDEKLNNIGFSDTRTLNNNLMSYFARARLPGCTFVFTKSIRDKVIQITKSQKEILFDYDYLVGVVAFACSEVYEDNLSFILHRRLKSSLTAGGNGIWKRIKIEFSLFRKRNVKRLLAKCILDNLEVKNSIYTDLKLISEYDKNIASKIALVRNNKFRTKSKICTIISLIKVFL